MLRSIVCALSLVCLVCLALPASAQFVVTNNNPTPTNSFAPFGSLGWAIDQANFTPGPNFITFNVGGGGPVVIQPDGEYVLTDPGTIIDGFSQPGSAPNFNPAPGPISAQIMVTVDGSLIPVGCQGPPAGDFCRGTVFRIETNGTIIRGLNVHSAPLYEIGICLANIGCTDNRIIGNYLGTDPTGFNPLPSGHWLWNPPMVVGVYLANRAFRNVIGSSSGDPADRNLISGEDRGLGALTGMGVLLDGSGGAPSDNEIVGNLIGTDAALISRVANNYGVAFLNGTADNLVVLNVIAGNHIHGVWMNTSGVTNSNNRIETNYIGIHPSIPSPIPNGVDGIRLGPGSQANVISDVNVISGNQGAGICIEGGPAFVDSFGNQITVNQIGTDSTGLIPVGNQGHGIYLTNISGGNEIGAFGQGNFISGNGVNGVWADSADNTNVIDNWIGLDQTGMPIPNGLNGIALTSANGCQLNANRVNFNGGHGVMLDAVANANVFQNDMDQNFGDGIQVLASDSSSIIDSNRVLNSQGHGIFLDGSSPTVFANTIERNALLGIYMLTNTGVIGDPLDDVVSVPSVTGNTIQDNTGGGIYCEDTEPLNMSSLHLTNTLADNNGQPRVLQYWWAAVEILDSGLNPITGGSHSVELRSFQGDAYVGGSTDGIIWGPAGVNQSNQTTWFYVKSYELDATGSVLAQNSFQVTVAGDSSGIGAWDFDGLNLEGNLGGIPTGVNTGGLYRYQVADVITAADSDGDGVPDSTDCAPNDAGYGLPANPCDTDSDGWCDAAISGLVQNGACPAECGAPMCTPTDCDDTTGAANPGQTEGPFGDPTCIDLLDNDCDGLGDAADPACGCSFDSDCDDGDFCTGVETCVAGTCVSGTPPNCDDGDACTVGDTCSGGGCVPGVPADCDDGLTCTTDSCDPVGGCINAIVPGSCLIMGACVANGSPNPANQCELCDPAVDQFGWSAAIDGTGCNDGDGCTMDDACSSGTCTGAPLDADGDGYADDACGGDDCNDANPNINPGMTEGPEGDPTCSDGLDNDCDGVGDQFDSGCNPNPLCGNGVIDAGEECDDNDLVSGDGCSNLCLVEAGYACRPGSEPSLCGSAALPGDLVITEMLIDPDCTVDSSGEWFEIVNISGRDLELNGWELSDDSGDSMVLYSGLVPAGSIFVFCRDTDPAFNGGVTCDYAYWSVTLSNGVDELVLSDPAGILVDRVAYDDGVTFPNPIGASVSLTAGADATDNDDGANWCASTSPIPSGCGDLGTPGVANPICGCGDADGDTYQDAACGGPDCDDTDPAVNPGATEGPEGDPTCSDGVDNDCDGDLDAADTACQPPIECGNGVVETGEQCDDGNPDPGDGCSDLCSLEAGYACRPGIEPSLCGSVSGPGQLVITEIMQNPLCVGDSEGEWIEIRNGLSVEVDLTGWVLADDDSDATLLFIGIVPALSTYMLCRNADFATNGGVSCDQEYSAFILANGADEVVLYNPLDTLIDRVAYDDGATFPDPNGASIALTLNGDATTNDDGANWCTATTLITNGCGDFGTPGQVNPACGGACDDLDGDTYEDQACGGNDCDDSDPTINPGAAEICDDGIDQDCDGSDLPCVCDDLDGDSYEDQVCGGTDCDDSDPAINPGATEICDDGIDQDCNGADLICGCADVDGDGYEGDGCGGTDCDDSDPAINPGATEDCVNGIDDDCDDDVDGADSDCAALDCGNGVLDGAEGCDDGGNAAGDGCSATCAVEAGFACRAGTEPSLCGHQAAEGALVITEIMQNPSCAGDTQAEWFEVHNASGAELNLGGWSVTDDGGESSVIDALLVGADDYAVLCRDADPGVNGNVTCDAVFSGSLGNGDDELILSNPADGLVDRVAWDGGALFPDPTGTSMSLTAGGDATSNDDGANWCEAITPITGGCGDLGTPGQANPACGGACWDNDGDTFEDETCGGTDCDDGDATIYPGATETCDDGLDQDCNGADLTCGCADVDGDGYQDTACGGNDCDDTDATVNPAAVEVCDDTVDNDCDGDLDGDDPDCQACADADGDGYEDAACGGDDCDDSEAAVNPGAAEECTNGIDDDCDADVDDQDSDCQACTTDLDGDGYLDDACGGDDCDDDDAAVNPGAAEICDDGADNDCDGDADAADSDCGACQDADGDGYTSDSCGGTDCDDADELVNPAAFEDCADGVDNDCDGDVDGADDECGKKASGCGCSTNGPSGLIWSLLLLLGLAILRRRRT